MPARFDVDDIRLNVDPAAPQSRFREAVLGAALLPASTVLPHGIPWPPDAATIRSRCGDPTTAATVIATLAVIRTS